MPTISYTTVNPMIVPAGNTISPFHDVTISDSGANLLDSATLTVTGGGTLSGAGLTPGAPGVYTTAALPPSQLTDIISKATFTPPPLGGQTSVETDIRLDVADSGGVVSITTAITEIAPPPPPPPSGGNFSITDQTTGQQTFASGDPYTGPVTGIDRELIHVTPDNLNITSSIPNVFIHSGSGMDGLNVSVANGSNILDGSTGSNFLIGGTGNDTFYLDDRGPTSPIFSTIVNFHAGDNATVWGVNATDFKMTMLDNQGAAGAKGLDLLFSAPGQADTSFVLVGYTSADMSNGRLSLSYGTTPDLPGLPGSQYLTMHAN